jgi:hypothetical protein
MGHPQPGSASDRSGVLLDAAEGVVVPLADAALDACEPFALPDVDARGLHIQVAAGSDGSAVAVACTSPDEANAHSGMLPSTFVAGSPSVDVCSRLSTNSAAAMEGAAHDTLSSSRACGAQNSIPAFSRYDVLGLPVALQALLRGAVELLPPRLRLPILQRLTESASGGLLRLWFCRAVVMAFASIVTPLALLTSVLVFLRALWAVDRVVTVHFASLCLLLVAIAIADAAMSTG